MATDDTTAAVSDGLALRELENGTYVVLHGRQPGQSLSTTVVLAVAEVLDVDHDTLDPLSDVVNPDTLDMFASSATDGFIAFNYTDCRISIESSGSIHIDPEPTD